MEGDDESGKRPATPLFPEATEATEATQKTKAFRPPSESLYNALWVSYRDGVRERRSLMRLHKMAWNTVNHAIEYGWPTKGWPSLMDRAALWDKQALAAKTQELAQLDTAAAEAKGRREAASWTTFQPRAVALANQGQEILEILAQKLKSAVQAATFVRYRRVRTVDENGHDVLRDVPYVDGVSVATAARQWAAAFKETGGVMSFLMGGPPMAGDLAPPELTEAQIAELSAGRLPPGMTLEMVARAVMTTTTTTGTNGE